MCRMIALENYQMHQQIPQPRLHNGGRLVLRLRRFFEANRPRPQEMEALYNSMTVTKYSARSGRGFRLSDPPAKAHAWL